MTNEANFKLTFLLPYSDGSDVVQQYLIVHGVSQRIRLSGRLVEFAIAYNTR